MRFIGHAGFHYDSMGAPGKSAGAFPGSPHHAATAAEGFRGRPGKKTEQCFRECQARRKGVWMDQEKRNSKHSKVCRLAAEQDGCHFGHVDRQKYDEFEDTG